MVNHGRSHSNGWFRGTSISGNPHIAHFQRHHQWVLAPQSTNQALRHVREAIALGSCWGSNAQIWRNTLARLEKAEVRVSWGFKKWGVQWNHCLRTYCNKSFRGWIAGFNPFCQPTVLTSNASAGPPNEWLMMEDPMGTSLKEMPKSKIQLKKRCYFTVTCNMLSYPFRATTMVYNGFISSFQFWATT